MADLLYLILILISIQQLIIISEATGLNLTCKHAQCSSWHFPF